MSRAIHVFRAFGYPSPLIPTSNKEASNGHVHLCDSPKQTQKYNGIVTTICHWLHWVHETILQCRRHYLAMCQPRAEGASFSAHFIFPCCKIICTSSVCLGRSESNLHVHVRCHLTLLPSQPPPRNATPNPVQKTPSEPEADGRQRARQRAPLRPTAPNPSPQPSKPRNPTQPPSPSRSLITSGTRAAPRDL